MPFPYTFPFVFAVTPVLVSGDAGNASDVMALTVRKSGSDLILRGHRPPVGLPQKEVKL